LDYIIPAKPNLVFLHLDLMDHASHTEGFESPAYDEALLHCDRLLGPLMAEIEIPWMIHGPGVVLGKELTGPINTFDTASTIAQIFGLRPLACWIGRPVREAFPR
jgi:predicted AlkP superfamily pyrophosphatase or phosphodiesterase